MPFQPVIIGNESGNITTTVRFGCLLPEELVKICDPCKLHACLSAISKWSIYKTSHKVKDQYLPDKVESAMT